MRTTLVLLLTTTLATTGLALVPSASAIDCSYNADQDWLGEPACIPACLVVGQRCESACPPFVRCQKILPPWEPGP